jgi:UPF0716 family protein affecting phage T7 exclusion
MATSIVGVWLLRRSGRADLERLRAGLAQDGLRAVHLERPGVAPMLGGILLVFPGFITDLLGAALFVPVLRRWATARLADAARKRRRRPDDDRVIDLAPDEYHQLPDHTRSRRGKSDDGATVRTKTASGQFPNPTTANPRMGQRADQRTDQGMHHERGASLSRLSPCVSHAAIATLASDER